MPQRIEALITPNPVRCKYIRLLLGHGKLMSRSGKLYALKAQGLEQDDNRGTGSRNGRRHMDTAA